MKRIFLSGLSMLSIVFGRFQWAPPPWLIGIFRQCRQHPLALFSIIGFLGLFYSAYWYIQSLPQAIQVKTEIEVPALTQDYRGAKPDSLNIHFQYDLSKLKEGQSAPKGQPSVARIDLVGEVISSGVNMTPSIPGTWRWLSERHLQFTPEKDWPPGTEYTLAFDNTLFTQETRLSEDEKSFHTQKLGIQIRELSFYQDPKNISVRRVISTLSFTHPVDRDSVKKALNLGMRPTGASVNTPLSPVEYSIDFEENLRKAYIQSAPITLPKKENYMTLAIGKGVKSILGGQDSELELSDKVNIPDLYSYLKVSSATVQIVRNQENEPEQILNLGFTDDIDEKTLAEKLHLYALPKDFRSRRAGEVDEKWLKLSEPISLDQIPNPRAYSKHYSFKIDVEENKKLYLLIDKGLVSVNNFVYNRKYDRIMQAPRYPREVNIAGDGSVLTNSGNQQLTVLSRGIKAIRFSVARLLDGQINHLISQTSGDINNPYFNGWRFDAKNLAQYHEKIVPINTQHPKHANYASLNLSSYIDRDEDEYGLFFINAHAYDPVNNRDIHGINDQRLILVTDLGLIVKDNRDNSHEVFVQSIKNGMPVANAKVELLGKNGVAIFSKYTSEDGHVHLPSTKGLLNEKEPVVYVVKTEGDMSFIPFDRYSRQINLSKFDIGGVNQSYYHRGKLNAFGFSDRGIYRPGEKVSLAFIVKNFDLSNVENIPLEVVVQGPRNNQVDVKRVQLPELGLLDYQYQSDATSDTGQYSVSLHIVSSKGRRGAKIGTTSFKVEEFQPDTMKISSELLGLKSHAWSTDEKLSAKVNLQNLFGLPAQDRKMQGRLIIQPANFSFKEYEGYTFTPARIDNSKSPLSIDEYLAQQKTDADGEVKFDIDLGRFRDGTYRLQFIAEGFDQSGGRSVTARNTALISPLEYLVGFKANGKLNYINADAKRSINVIALDTQLRKIAKDKLSLKKIAIQHVSTLVKQPNGTYQYQTITKEAPLDHQDFSIAEQGETLPLDTNEPGDYAIEIYDQDQRRLARVEYSVIGAANLTGKIDKNAELQLKLARTDYKSGDLIEMSIKAPYVGAGLITIETDKVHAHKWFRSKTQSSVQSIALPEGIEGTAYINVTFVRDVGSKEIFTSPLSYAVQPFSIDKSKRRVDIDLDIAELVRPGKPMKIGYSTNKKSKIIVFAVDEGILQVAKYQTPKPLEHYLKKRALGVETLQILDLILPEFNLVRELSAAGGGSAKARKALAKNLNPFSRKVDKPAVYWSGVVNADNEKNTLTFNVPDTFSGSLRVMAVAVSEAAFGASSESTIVRGPFVISPNVLTQAAPGDEFIATIGVANIIDGSGKNAPIDISLDVSEHLEILAEQHQRINIDEGSEGHVDFRLRANDKLGAASITVIVKHKEADKQEETQAKRSASISVRPVMPYYSSFTSGFTDDGDETLELTRELYQPLSDQYISASTSPLVLVDGLRDYLQHFPHGCTEQVVSKVFPIIGLMSHPAYSSSASSDREKVAEYFNHVVGKLRERQQGAGGFSFWPGGGSVAQYPSIYATHFLLEAKAQGFPVPTDMLSRVKHYLRDFVGQQSDTLDHGRERANAIYLLTLMGEVTTNYLVELHESLELKHKKTWKKDLVASYMAASYKLLKKDNEAHDLIRGYKLGQHKQQRFGDFHSPLTQDAQHLYLLAKHFEKNAQALEGEAIMRFIEPIFQGRYNTIASAYSILALGAYSEVVFDEKVDKAIRFSMESFAQKEHDLTVSTDPFAKAEYDTTAAKVSMDAQEALYYLNVQNGFDKKLPQKAIREGLEIHRDFLDSEGKKVTSVKQGQELTVRLRLRALGDRYLSNIAVVDLLPGGFEVIRSSVKRTAYNWRADYVDIREDRIIYYGGFDSNVRDLIYKVKATASGEFTVPPSFAKSMYDREIQAVAPAGKISVLDSE